MLLQINIKNFALIENLSISFAQGFNVLSGETGAGKSILIDAINFVLGSKFNKELIRTGESKTLVEAIFIIDNEKTKEILKNMSIEFEDLVIINRETFQSGKTIVKVNGKALILSSLKHISSTLLDIHGQHENQNLLHSENHIIYLDNYAEEKLLHPMEQFKENYNQLQKIKKKLYDVQGKDDGREKLMDFLKFQIDEITNAKLEENEEDDLKKQFNLLSNAEKVNNILNNAYFKLFEEEGPHVSIYDNLGHIIKDIKSIEDHVDEVKKINSLLEEAFYNIEGTIESIRSLKDSVVYDEKKLEYINSRIFDINGYKKKYGKNIKDILKYKDDIQRQYDELVNSEEIIKKLKNEEELIYEKLKSLGETLNEVRTKYALLLEEAIKEQLNYIGLEKSIFKVNIEKVEKVSINGFDKVQFMISTNPGEPLKPLEKIVSGGELSRMMLALKTVFVFKDSIPSIIFDEIDTGISGRIAQAVAEKMYTISKHRQVFCVTHLPQIAAMSDHHFVVSKMISKDKTYTEVKNITKQEKIIEIAKMLGGKDVTELTMKHSEEMIYLAGEKKSFM